MCMICEAMERNGNDLCVFIANKQIPATDVVRITGYIVGTIIGSEGVSRAEVLLDFFAGLAKGTQVAEAMTDVLKQSGFLDLLAGAETCDKDKLN